MEAWVIVAHYSEMDFTQAWGRLIGGLYSDIESACRGIKDEMLLPNDSIVGIEYFNSGRLAKIVTAQGRIFGARLMSMPMRDEYSD